jgi:propanediol utilization protein
MARIGTYTSKADPAEAANPDAPLPVSGAVTVSGSVSTLDNLPNPTKASGDLTGITAANTVIADTGQLAAGVYLVEIELGFSGTLVAGKHIIVQHRDAANAANINTLGLCPGGDSRYLLFRRVVVAANERIRAAVGAVATLAGEVVHASIRAYLLP